jgi:o-succinylbenzoate synthase
MLEASYTGYPLYFTHPSGTSRGVLTEKPCWFIRLRREDGVTGTGEVSFIPGLSMEDPGEIGVRLDQVCKSVTGGFMDPDQALTGFPGIQFALECAMLDLEGGGEQLLYPSDFTEGRKGIQINGLIWMGDPGYMKVQIWKKLDQGFRVLKMKVGALEMEQELEVLSWIRSQFGNDQLEIRLDANGAWAPGDALGKMERYAEYGIHSVEQPIAAGQWEAMGRICRESPVPVALDEELIGLDVLKDGPAMLRVVSPGFLILKPGLLGGFRNAGKWIGLAEEAGAGWWVTSALESSVGLNAIAQWTCHRKVTIPQGLGTGTIYRNNIPSPLQVESDSLWYRKERKWNMEGLFHS